MEDSIAARNAATAIDIDRWPAFARRWAVGQEDPADHDIFCEVMRERAGDPA
jgi:hypothetical protein